MPEGDTIYNTAARLRAVGLGKRLHGAQARDAALEPDSLPGRTIADIQTRGKHLLIHLDDGRVIHSHLGMTGSWHIYQPGEPWKKPAHRAVLVLETDAHLVICFTPKLLELLRPSALLRHPMLARLGPDILSPDFSPGEVVARFRARRELPIGEAVMDQTIVCGIGNIYKSETLFLARCNPFRPLAELPDERIEGVVELARKLMTRNLSGYPRRIRPSLRGRPFWVYGREGQGCFRCGRPILVRRQGDLGRTTFWCPGCQES